MIRRMLTAAAFGLAFVSISSALQAQASSAREGFYIGFGVGGGSIGIDCEGCPSDREGGVSGYFRLGGAVSPKLLVGAETNGWTKSDDGIDGTVGSLSGVAYFYPSLQRDFFVKGGLSLVSSTIEGGGDELSSTGFGLTIGAGYDFRIGRQFAITPYLNYIHALTGEADGTFDGADVPGGIDMKPSLLQVGVGFNWY